jgi:hypothetical protein
MDYLTPIKRPVLSIHIRIWLSIENIILKHSRKYIATSIHRENRKLVSMVCLKLIVITSHIDSLFPHS